MATAKRLRTTLTLPEHVIDVIEFQELHNEKPAAATIRDFCVHACGTLSPKEQRALSKLRRGRR